MKTKYVLTLSLVFISLFGCSQIKSKFNFGAILDPSLGRNLLQQCSRATPIKNVTDYWLVSQEDIDSLEHNFSNLDSLTAKRLEGCGVQYVGVVIKKRKYIYINAFPKGEIELMKKYQPAFDPTTSPIVVCDGGPSFWGALFDVEKKEFSNFSFNGIA